MAFRPTLWPTLFTIPAVIVLLALGTWQVQRLHWKAGLIEKLQARSVAAPIPLPAKIGNPGDFEYRRVKVRGRFRHKKEYYLVNRSRAGKPGLNIITPLARADGGADVLVNRGWTPFELRERESRAAGLVKGTHEVEGIFRLAKGPGLFMPKNEPHNNTWFYIDPPAMAAAGALGPVGPYFILAGDKSVGGYPIDHRWQVNLHNAHLEYAITWYALAVALVVIYFLYHRRPRPSDE